MTSRGGFPVSLIVPHPNIEQSTVGTFPFRHLGPGLSCRLMTILVGLPAEGTAARASVRFLGAHFPLCFVQVPELGPWNLM